VSQFCLKEPVKRVLALTETCLVERDPATYNIATLKPLGEVFALVCDSENPQLFTIEFIKGQIRKYSSTERYFEILVYASQSPPSVRKNKDLSS